MTTIKPTGLRKLIRFVTESRQRQSIAKNGRLLRHDLAAPNISYIVDLVVPLTHITFQSAVLPSKVSVFAFMKSNYPRVTLICQATEV